MFTFMQLDRAAEAPLIERSRHGDKLAFEQLYKTHHRATLRQVVALTGIGEPAAHDVVQEAFLRAYQAVGRFRGDACFRTWIVRIAMNVARSSILRAQRWQTQPLLEDEVFDETDPFDELLGQLELELERQDLIGPALAKLKENHRKALLMQAEGLSCAEIANTLGVPVGTVMSRLFHARRNLIKAFEAGKRRRALRRR